jgi:hypothetical protein
LPTFIRSRLQTAIGGNTADRFPMEQDSDTLTQSLLPKPRKGRFACPPQAFTEYYASGAVRMKVPVVLEFRGFVLGVFRSARL